MPCAAAARAAASPWRTCNDGAGIGLAGAGIDLAGAGIGLAAVITARAAFAAAFFFPEAGGPSFVIPRELSRPHC